MDLLEKIETYQIMCEVFYEYIPKEQRVLALSQAAERIKYEIKDSEDESPND